jgi:hypothetical protein
MEVSVLRQQSRNARGNVVTRARRMSSLLKANRRRCHRGNITTMTKGKLLPSDGPVREWEHETCRVMTPSWVPEAKKYPIGLSPIPASRSSDRGTSALEKRLWSAGWRKWALTSRHMVVRNDRFGGAGESLGMARLGRFLPFAPGDRPNDGSRRIGDQIRANSALR